MTKRFKLTTMFLFGFLALGMISTNMGLNTGLINEALAGHWK